MCLIRVFCHAVCVVMLQSDAVLDIVPKLIKINVALLHSFFFLHLPPSINVNYVSLSRGSSFHHLPRPPSLGKVIGASYLLFPPHSHNPLVETGREAEHTFARKRPGNGVSRNTQLSLAYIISFSGIVRAICTHIHIH